MPIVVTSVSSVGTSRAINLDWRNAEPIGVAVTGSSSGTFAYTIQTTLDDLMVTAASAVSWINDPNATALTSNSSAVFTYTAPLTGVRINSTGLSSAILTVRVVQGEI
jgi:hypothetical protein